MMLAAMVLLMHGMVLQGLRWDVVPADQSPRTWQVQMPPSSLAPPKARTANTSPQAPTPPQPTPERPTNPTGLHALNESPLATQRMEPSSPPTDLTNAAETSAQPMPAPASLANTDEPPAAETTPHNPAYTALQKVIYRWPEAAKLVFDFVGESKGIRYGANGDLIWQHDGQHYQLRQEVRHMLLGSRSQTSQGSLGELGLQPDRFGDKFKQEVAAHFERHKGVVSFSANTPSVPIQEGAQDRLSLFLQFAALMQGNPEMRELGQQLSLQVVSGRSAEIWTFSVEKQETLNLPIGNLPALKLSRLPTQKYDQTIDIWLSPNHGYLPVRVRIAQSNGDLLEQFLRKVEAP